MSLFRRYPKRDYLTASNDRKRIVDILRRVRISEKIKTNGDLFVRYRLKDGERLERVAYKLYRNPQYDWILMLLNNVINPYEDLPIDQRGQDALIEKRYPGYALFTAVREGVAIFSPGEIITTPNGYQATVVSQDYQLRKLVVTNEINATSLTADETITGQTSGAAATFKRRVFHQESLHHFEDADGEWVDPNPTFITDPTGTESSPLEIYVNGGVLSEFIEVTNREDEERRNEEVRTVSVLRPEYIDRIVGDIEAIFANRSIRRA